MTRRSMFLSPTPERDENRHSSDQPRHARGRQRHLCATLPKGIPVRSAGDRETWHSLVDDTEPADPAAHIQSLDWQPDHCLASFHGLPETFIQAGDPYQSHCESTFARLQSALGADDDFLRLVYQSRGRGRAPWTGPQLEETLADLAGKGAKNLCVVTPGFASDCVETLEEVQIRAARTFRAHGGTNFSFVPCLNASDAAITLMHDLARENLAGWR
jgi:protoheme ferro-lyase